MRNKTVIILLATLITTALLFNGCGKKEIETETVVSEIVEENEDTVSVAEPEIVEDIVEEELAEVEETDNTISDNWEDLEFLLEGIKFKIPCYIKEFEKTGWIFRTEASASRDVLPHCYNFNHQGLFHDEKKGYMVLDPYNDTDETIDIKESITDAIRFERVRKDNIINVVLAKGITYGSTKQEVLEAYGEPTKISKAYYTTFDYVSKEKSVRMAIGFDENECVNSISLHDDKIKREDLGMEIYSE